jgi:hypothetical protein
MNNILIKQDQKEKHEKKPKKKVKLTQKVIQDRLLIHFQNHIGQEDKTTSEEIFQAVVGVNSAMVDSYARFYWFDIIQKVMRKLRREDKCFIIKKKEGYFVLKSQSECVYYQGLCDTAIGRMEKAKIRADAWVENAKWKDMKIPSEDEVGVEEVKAEKSILPPEETYKDKLKTKVIKLWKGGTEE